MVLCASGLTRLLPKCIDHVTRKGKTTIRRGSISNGRWTVTSRVAFRLLFEVSKFLRTKAEQASLAMAFQEQMDYRQFEKNRPPVTDDMIIWREEMKDKIDAANPRIQRIKAQRAEKAARALKKAGDTIA